ncbi:transcriptional regulator GcvA [Jannaschia aquimarina]|uniref:GcvA_1 protein n=1 Tax=Jannaschia aquimarina TaxID=935700 RepID=A0A0D1CPF9_9RHOB|nr:transcriptional regulator GcvA [Jannaschia aquimarina]KIT16647.1 Glycine cleavage system transcriptional activator [Jannaschia aquimarina]SNS93408.1 transcriptional regulator, LysR family [Jannaschia aquimarina]
MPDRLPPLTALRAFEAAARHLSFRDAAAELNVTPAALSFQIKALEEHLGAALFRRLNRRVELTEAGAALAPGTTEGFGALQTAWRAACRTQEAGVLTVTAGPAFTARWLAPRMFLFAREHPEVELRFSATLRLLDFARDDIDLAIRFGIPPARGEEDLHQALAIREWMTPMMHPDLAGDFPTPESLRSATLIHQDDTAFFDPPMDWPVWFRAAGVTPPDMHGPRFSQADHALDAAQAGAGVVLGRGSLADAALRSGALVAPFDIALVPRAHFRVLCPEGAQNRPYTRAFLDWLSAEIGAMEDHGAGHRMVPVEDLL